MGTITLKYQKWFDDPYKFLAQYLVSRSSIREIKRLLDDDNYIYRLVIQEFRLVDYNTPFADCVFHEQAHGKARMELMHAIDDLAAYFYKRLDLVRLRKEIEDFCSELDIFQEDIE